MSVSAEDREKAIALIHDDPSPSGNVDALIAAGWRPSGEFDGDTSAEALAAWARYQETPTNFAALTLEQQEQDAFTAGFDAARYKPSARALLPDEEDEPVPTSPSARQRLGAAAETLYATAHRLAPEDLNGHDRKEALEQLLPLLRDVGDTAWWCGYEQGVEDERTAAAVDLPEYRQPNRISPYGGGF